jgi:aspartyl-tRNA(Asn)/glutamyl-tRNA(Gln) amidotransferase subunit C
VRRIAQLAHLSLAEEEEARMSAELGAILTYIELLRAVDTAGVEVTTHPVPLADALDEDAVRDGVPAADALSAASDADRERGFFRVPRVV